MEDEEFLKMATVKKAYAEIILNTSKEAAARIMVADRRALCFEKELFALKHDALRMLVQLKQTLDSKNAEAEFRSANHQKKIEELEAQLSEAEGIILDLRDDLKLAQYKLEKQKQPSKQQNIISQNGHQLVLETEGKVRSCDRSYQSKEYLSSENKCSINKTAETIRSAQEQPSTLFQFSTYRVKSGREQCSSCSSESDEKDTKSSCYGSEAKLLEYEGHYIKDGRDGFRRTRKNVKYREAIAALRGCSRGRRSRSCQLPSFPRCSRTYSMNHNNDTAVEKSSEILVNESDFGSDMGPLKLKPSTGDSNLHVQISEGKSTQAESDKALKFTFQRKRKRVLSKLDNNIAPVGNKEGYPAKLQKTMVNDEKLAKDCQQLLQVAHQLIALSGNDPS